VFAWTEPDGAIGYGILSSSAFTNYTRLADVAYKALSSDNILWQSAITP
jgi:hypothetical protein